MKKPMYKYGRALAAYTRFTITTYVYHIAFNTRRRNQISFARCSEYEAVSAHSFGRVNKERLSLASLCAVSLIRLVNRQNRSTGNALLCCWRFPSCTPSVRIPPCHVVC